MTISEQLKQYANEDIHSLQNFLQERYNLKTEIMDLSYNFPKDVDANIEDPNGYRVASVTASLKIGSKKFAITLNYIITCTEIQLDYSIAELGIRIYNQARQMIAASSITERPILSAEDEESTVYEEDDGDIVTDTYEGDGIGDLSEDLSELSDSLENVQEELQSDDIEEDEINIEKENNIANHYIAECDSCHGIFISAVMESDQELSSITGICPLCGKETTQYLNWIIRDVDKKEEEEY